MSEPSSSYFARWFCLAAGVVWGLAALLVVLHLHVNPDNLRDPSGQPVFRTVYARNPELWVANFVGIGTAVAIAVVELAIRTWRTSPRTGVVAMVLGSLLCCYSVLGLLYGVVAIAPIGVLVILSGMPVARDRAGAEAPGLLPPPQKPRSAR